MWTICLVWRQLKRGPNIHHRSYLHPYYADCVNSPWVKHPDSAALANSSWCSGPMYCKQMGHTGSLRGPYIRRKTSVNSGNQFGLKPKRQVHRVILLFLFFTQVLALVPSWLHLGILATLLLACRPQTSPGCRHLNTRWTVAEQQARERKGVVQKAKAFKTHNTFFQLFITSV